MPDAPAPVYNSAGTRVSPWTIRLAYDDVTDRVSLTCHRPAAQWAPALDVSLTFAPGDLPDALAHLGRFAEGAHAVRLF